MTTIATTTIEAAYEVLRLAAKANGLPEAGRGVTCPACRKSVRAEHVFGLRDKAVPQFPLLRCLECAAEFPAIGWVVCVDQDDTEIAFDTKTATYAVSATGLIADAKLLDAAERTAVEALLATTAATPAPIALGEGL